MEYFDISKLFKPKVQNILKKDEKELNEEEKYIKEFFEDIIKDTEGKIPKEIGEMIVELNNDPNYTLMIHRAGNGDRGNIFNNGLEIRAGNMLKKTANANSDIALLKEIINSYGYKNYNNEDSNCILLKIPNENLEYIPGKTKPMLIETDKEAFDEGMATHGRYQTIIPSSYILGAIEFKGENIVGFEENSNYGKEINDIGNNRLVCTGEAISSYKKKNKNIEDKSDKNINSIIINEYNCAQEYVSRTESELKSYSKKDMILSKFNETVSKIKNFFIRGKDNTKEEDNVDREQ